MGATLTEDLFIDLKDNWGTQPDYVFKDNYKLTSLKDLEAFVNTNHHLPDVPSQAQIKEDGVLNLTNQTIGTLNRLDQHPMQLSAARTNDQGNREPISI